MTTLNTENLASATRTVTFNGEAVTVPTNVTDIAAFIRTENKRRGITTFTALVNGREIGSVSELDSAFSNGNVLEVRTYAKPGA